MARFLFATGIEESYPVIRDGGAPLRRDEMELCGHSRRWRPARGGTERKWPVGSFGGVGGRRPKWVGFARRRANNQPPRSNPYRLS
jgi:hypothetical protein